MGIQNGSISLCRYRLLGGGRRFSLAKLSELIEPHKAGPVKLSGVFKEDLAGWVRPVGLDKVELPLDASWDLTQCQLDDGFLLRMRIEKRKVPATLHALLFKQKMGEHEQKAGKLPPPRERRDVKDQMKRDLMAKALPTIAHVDGFWRDKESELTLFATGKKQRELFEALFSASFAGPLELSLVRMDPPLTGLGEDAWTDSSVASRTFGRLSSTTPWTALAPLAEAYS